MKANNPISILQRLIKILTKNEISERICPIYFFLHEEINKDCSIFQNISGLSSVNRIWKKKGLRDKIIPICLSSIFTEILTKIIKI